MSTDLSRPLVQRRVNDKRTHSLLTLVVDDELGVLSRLITEEVANGVLADHMTRQELPRSGSAKGGDEPPCDSVKIARPIAGHIVCHETTRSQSLIQSMDRLVDGLHRQLIDASLLVRRTLKLRTRTPP